MPSRSLIVAALLCALFGAGCSTTPASIGWGRAVDRQPLVVRVHRDSADEAWRRAGEWLRSNAAAREVIESHDRLETRPDPEGSTQRWYSVVRSYDGDSVRLEFDYEYGLRQPIDILGAVGAPNSARELSLFAEKGVSWRTFESTYRLDSVDLREATDIDAARPHRLWAALGTGAYGPSFEAGFRRDWWGFSYGVSDFDGAYDPLPRYDSVAGRPVAPYRKETFAGLFSGITALGFLDIGREVSLYGGVGLYVRADTELAREDATGRYYEQGSSAAWRDPALALTAGVQLSLGERLVLGGGYGTVAGVHGQLGWRW